MGPFYEIKNRFAKKVDAVSGEQASSTSASGHPTEGEAEGVATEAAAEESTESGDGHGGGHGDGQKAPSARRRRKGAASGGAQGAAEAAATESPVQKFRRVLRVFAEKHGLYSIKQLYRQDKETRRMVYLLGFSGLALFLLLIQGAVQCGRNRIHSAGTHEPSAADAEKEALNREREKVDQEASWLTLERMSFELRLNPASKKTDPMRKALFDLAIHTDSPETKAYLEEAVVPVRAAMDRSLVGWDRETLLTADGKKKLIAGMMDALNNLLPEGKITEMYFTKFIFK